MFHCCIVQASHGLQIRTRYRALHTSASCKLAGWIHRRHFECFLLKHYRERNYLRLMIKFENCFVQLCFPFRCRIGSRCWGWVLVGPIYENEIESAETVHLTTINKFLFFISVFSKYAKKKRERKTRKTSLVQKECIL